MAQVEAPIVNSSTLEALQNQSALSRRARPPDIEIVGDENRVPLRISKLQRRESRIGLRNFFGRSKGAKEFETVASPRELSRPGGIRASLAEISNWPYSLQSPRSELTLPTIHSRPQSAATDIQSVKDASKHKKSSSGGKQLQQGGAPVKSSRGSLATWDPPPLFQAYPQAIKHAQLRASGLSADAIIRLNERRGSSSIRDDLTQTSLSSELADESGTEKSSDKSKRKHRRNLSSSSNKYEWTTKIYVLVTSGYLLQYAGEGSFDRLPEKMLHLGKDSAAFASDVIPGRHWVIQVSSSMEADGTASSDSRSLFSRLPFRGVEKRNASNFLMVFESAEDMESWIAVLRREIESLGGKKNLSETGKPKADDEVVELRNQPSQRTLVVRDPERFSRVFSQDFSWQAHESISDDAEGSVTVVESDLAPDHTLDDVSTTNSFVSHDGRQLENLRDSAHRLSYISSGQRTIVTSADSSPACSPTRDSFASQLDDAQLRDLSQEVRVRPNAAAISDRRQSMQAMTISDMRGQAAPRPHSTYGTSIFAEQLMPAPTTPNFSVPHAVSRRYSLAKSGPPDSAPFPPQPLSEREYISRPRKSPPTSLPMTRPLSIVADHPSPIHDEPQIPEEPPVPPKDLSPSPVQTTESRPVTRARADSQNRVPNSFDVPSRRSSLVPQEHIADLTIRTSPRKFASMQCLRTSEVEMISSEPLPFNLNKRLPSPPPLPSAEEELSIRSKSSMEYYDRSRSRSPGAKRSHQKRASLQSNFSDQSQRCSVADPQGISSTLLAEQLRRRGLPMPTSMTRYSRDTLQVKASLPNRRSMPQLLDGPPPAPPPTCALPPIPQGLRAKA
jgi:hypothetical protein